MIGTILQERYRLDQIIGEGGMGVVYRGYDTILQRPIAVKLLSHAHPGSEGQERMLIEAQATARLNHPNIVTVYDVGRSEEAPFIVMELVEGQRLRQVKPDSYSKALEIGQSICLALDHAHKNGIIHRDLKPENIFLTNSSVIKLMDFGLAQMRGGPNITSEGTLLGTFNYMAPELLNGGKATVQSDLYALGIILYELAAGRPPFDGENIVAILSQHLNAPVTPPSTYNPAITPACDHLLLQLLRKEPQLRPRSAADVYRALSFIIEEPAEEPSRLTAEFSLLDRIVRGRLVARQAELQQLNNLWQHSRQGNANIALLSGEPGAGKTRLAEEFLVEARLRCIPILRGGCYEYEAVTPYLPLVEALREWVHAQDTAALIALLGDTVPELARLVPEIETKLGPQPASPPLSPEDARSRLFDNIARFLQTLSSEQGLIIFIDDLHWADGATLNLLHYLMRRLRRERLFILANYREVELDRTHPLSAALVTWNQERLATRISIGRFTKQETAEMLAALFGQDQVEGDFAAAIYHETEGNPFFIEEVVKALIDQEQIYRQDGEWFSHDIDKLAIPQSVKEAIGRRLNRLSQEVIDILHIAAVLGKQFDFADLDGAGNQNEEFTLNALDEAINAQLIRLAGGESFAFTHDKIREVLYGEINPIRRRRIHKRIAQTLESRYKEVPSNVVQELAFHYVQAADLEKGLAFSIAAAERAFDLSSLEEAITYYEQAAQCAIGLEDTRQQMEIGAQLGRLNILTGNFAGARAAYKKAIKLATDAGDKAALTVKYIGVDIHAGEKVDTDLLQESIEKLDPVAQKLDMAEALSILGRHYHYQSDYVQAVTHQERAYELAQSLDDPFIMTNIMGNMAGAYQHQFLMDECMDWAWRSIAYGESHDYLEAVALGYEFLAETSNLMGNCLQGYEYALQNEAVGQRLGSRVRIAWANMSKSWACHRLGRFDEVIEYGHRAIELSLASDLDRLIALTRYTRIMSYIDTGQFEAAEEEIAVLVTLVNRINQQWVYIQANHVRALNLAARGEVKAALQLLEALNQSTSSQLVQTVRIFIGCTQAELLHILGRNAEAEALLHEIIATTIRTQSSWQQGIAYRVLGQVMTAGGQTEAALTAFEKAVTNQREHSSLPELARSLYYRGLYYESIDEFDKAEIDLKEAQSLADELNLELTVFSRVFA